ncbi:MAG: hypothetical protein ABI557_15400, partial [Aureliella sp.]
EMAAAAWFALLLALVAADSVQQSLHLPLGTAAQVPRSNGGVATDDWVEACRWIGRTVLRRV